MRIGVVGLGYVGLPLADALCEARAAREAPLVVDFRGVTPRIEAPNLVRL